MTSVQKSISFDLAVVNEIEQFKTAQHIDDFSEAICVLVKRGLEK
jgi:hypothetical protein